MGAKNFIVTSKGATAHDAFRAAVESAQYDYGHAGYTGTIAEKKIFTMVDLPAGLDAFKYARHLINYGDPRIDDKWGPAGCIALGGNEYLFFGWASS